MFLMLPSAHAARTCCPSMLPVPATPQDRQSWDETDMRLTPRRCVRSTDQSKNK